MEVDGAQETSDSTRSEGDPVSHVLWDSRQGPRARGLDFPVCPLGSAMWRENKTKYQNKASRGIHVDLVTPKTSSRKVCRNSYEYDAVPSRTKPGRGTGHSRSALFHSRTACVLFLISALYDFGF